MDGHVAGFAQVAEVGEAVVSAVSISVLDPEFQFGATQGTLLRHTSPIKDSLGGAILTHQGNYIRPYGPIQDKHQTDVVYVLVVSGSRLHSA